MHSGEKSNKWNQIGLNCLCETAMSTDQFLFGFVKRQRTLMTSSSLNFVYIIS